MPGGMKPADIADLIEVGDPRLSPDGAMVAFVVVTIDAEANEYRSRIWLAATDGSNPPRPFSSGEARDRTPRWSPDGRALAFVSHREDEGSQLLVLPVDAGGEVVKLASSPEEIDEVAWSPDGARLAFGARQRDEQRYSQKKPKDQPPRRLTRLFARLDSVGWLVDRPRHLSVVPADGSAKPTPVTRGPHQDGGLSWAADGSQLFFSSARHDSWDLDRASDLFVVSAHGDAEPDRLTSTGPVYNRPAADPAGTRVAYIFGGDPLSGPNNSELGVLDLASGTTRTLTDDLDRNCAPYLANAREPVWDGDDLWFQVEDRGNMPLFRVAADGSGKPEAMVTGDRMVTGFDVRDGVVAFTATTPTSLTELFVRDRAGTVHQLTSSGARFAASRELVAPERFTAASTDGEEVEAWIIRPAGFDPNHRYPLLLNIHGGPFSQYGNRLLDEFQIQAGAGYAVVYANPRGSSGYGRVWGRAIRGRTALDDAGTGWGGIDYEDLMAVVDEAVRRFDFVDGERLGVLGGSYGGYMTSWIVGHTDRFKAACSERAVNNVLTLEHNSDIATAFRSWMGRSHLDDPDEYIRQSPATYARRIHTPLLILHSEDDLRCPIGQAEELFVALRMLERDVEFVRFPGESHELSRSGAPKHRVQRMEIILEFFDKHLK